MLENTIDSRKLSLGNAFLSIDATALYKLLLFTNGTINVIEFSMLSENTGSK